MTFSMGQEVTHGRTVSAFAKRLTQKAGFDG